MEQIQVRENSSWTFVDLLTVTAVFTVMGILNTEGGWILCLQMVIFILLSGLLGLLICLLITKLRRKPTPVYVETSNKEDYAQRQNSSRDKLIEEHAAKAESYKERILIPRMEAKRKQKEKILVRHSYGTSFKGEGHTLGTESGTPTTRVSENLESRNAAIARRDLIDIDLTHLSQHLNEDDQEEQPEPAIKKVYQLPVEPSEDAKDQVRVTLRTPQGRFYVRRFHTSTSVQVLLDYMTIVGYHQSIYTLMTSIPRKSLHDVKQRTLEDVGFIGGVVLNVDLKDPDPTVAS